MKKTVDSDWPLDESRPPGPLVRVRHRKAAMSRRVTRKLAKIDAELLALAAGAPDARVSIVPTAPPPAPARVVVPPPLPFPFANAASPMTLTMSADDDFVTVRDSWLLPPAQRSLFPREPDPFTLRPPTYSLLPR